MAAIRGTSGVLEIGGTAVAEITSFTLDTTMDTIETTAMGDQSRIYVKGLNSFSVSGDFNLEAGDANAQYTEIGQFEGVSNGSGDPTGTITLYPEGNSTDAIKISGSVVVTGFSVTGSFDGIVTGSFTAQGTGDLTFAAAT